MTAVWAMRWEFARSQRFWLLVLVLMTGLAAAPLVLERGVSSPTAREDAFGRLPLSAKAPISKTLGRENPSFHASAAAGGFTIANDRHRLAASFGRERVLVRSGGDSFGLSLRGWGYGNSLSDLDAVSPRARANRVSYPHGALEEWWVNGPVGLEQGFTVRSAPAPTRSGPLTLELAVSGSLRPTLERGGDGIALRSKSGDSLLRYTGLVANDARGRPLPAQLELSGERLRVRVDDAGARYPLTIDPFVQQAKLTASDGEAGDHLGETLAMSGDTIVAGVPSPVSTDPSGDALYVFEKPASGWQDATQTAKLTAAGTPSGFGSSVAISGDTIVASGFESGKGTLYVFVKPAGGWQDGTQTAKLTSTNSNLSARGSSPSPAFAVSGDTIAVGADIGSTTPGAVLVFVKPAGGWQDATLQNAKLTASDGAPSDDLGDSVAVSGDTIVAGAPFEDAGDAPEDTVTSEGSAYVFEKPAGGWQDATENAKLTLSDRQPFDRLGWAVAVEGDTVVASAAFDEQGAAGPFDDHGSVDVFVKPAGGWQDATQTARLTASDGAAKDRLGESVAISGNRIVAGADADFFEGTGPGAAYVFAKPAAGWQDATENQKLTASDGATGDRFGIAVGISGDTIAVGAPFHSVGGNARQGTAYVFGLVPGLPDDLTLSPKTATNAVDTEHCVTATVEDASGTPTPDITVRFSVTGSVNTSGSEATDANGEATFCYQGPQLPGEDEISAFADTDNNEAKGADEPSDTATKTWTLPTSTPACKVTADGQITAANGDKASFGGNAQSDLEADVEGQVQYQDHGPAAPQKVKSIEVQALTCNQQRTRATIFGRATIDGQGSRTFRIDVQDRGEPGKSDTYRILLDTGYDSGERVLKAGNVQIKG